ncbi:hypothetical protein J437_LFUL007298 [Ladona fulva]|uniref:Bee-milk protein n=1 Tax=Ladona fulva TaxID=123851 RepID=A0A8K0KRA3_LADFU|nr:hypothetical protein J437_LFUL007298 [Ladona fulva]
MGIGGVIEPIERTKADFAFSWYGVNFQWPCSATKNIYTSSGRYTPNNAIITRVQYDRDYAYLTLPRFKSGGPVTLGRICLRRGQCNPVIEPYPCWSFQEEGNCKSLQNVVDIYMDVNNILWVLDIGVVNTMEQPIRRCEPKIVGLCTKTDKVVKVIDLSQLVCSSSRLQYLVADVASDGTTYIYVADAGTRSIIVYDVQKSRGFRVMLPKAVTSGCDHNDVLYFALVRKPTGASTLFLTYLCSEKIFSIRTDYLRKGTNSGRIITVGAKDRKIIFLGTDGGAGLFFRYKGDGDIYMWNTDTCFKRENFYLAMKGHGGKLSTHVVPGFRRLMWSLESNFQDYIQGTTGCLGASIRLKPVVKSCEY